MLPEDVFYCGITKHIFKFALIQEVFPDIMPKLFEIGQSHSWKESASCYKFPEYGIQFAIVWHRDESSVAQRYWFDWKQQGSTDIYIAHCYPVDSTEFIDDWVFGRSIGFVLHHAALLRQYCRIPSQNSSLSCPSIDWERLNNIGNQIQFPDEFVFHWAFMDYASAIYQPLSVQISPDDFHLLCRDRDALGQILRLFALTGAWFCWWTDCHNVPFVKAHPEWAGDVLAHDDYWRIHELSANFFISSYIVSKTDLLYDAYIGGGVF